MTKGQCQDVGHCLQESVFVDIAGKLLRKNLPSEFDLTLLNVGVTSFHDLSAPSGVSKISALFQGKAPLPVPLPSAPTGAPDGSAPDAAAPAVDAHADGLQLCCARRDYKGADGRAVVSKRRERALMDAKLATAQHAAAASAGPPGGKGHAPADLPVRLEALRACFARWAIVSAHRATACISLW